MKATDLVYLNGRRMDRATASACVQVAARIPSVGLTQRIVQGNNNPGGVGASGGTHDRDGAVDWSMHSLSARTQRKVAQHARVVGFAAWVRPRLVKGGRLVWNDHVHGILVCDQIQPSLSAAEQIGDYRRHQNGLAGHGSDPSWRPKGAPIEFVWRPAVTIYDLPAGKRRYRVKKGQRAAFRRAADVDSVIEFTRTPSSTVFVFDAKVRAGGRLWYRHAKTRLWVNAATLTAA